MSVIPAGYETIMVAATAAASGASVQRVSGMGLSLVAVPLLVLVFEPVDAIRICLLVGLPAYALTAFAARGSIRWRSLAQLAVPGLLLTPLLAALVRDAPARPLLLAAGCCCLVAAGALAFGVVSPRLAGTGGALGAGALAALMNSVSGIAGPPVAIYSMNAGWDPAEVRGTLSAYFLLLTVVAVPGLGMPVISAATWWALGAGLLVGVALGQLAGRHVHDRHARAMVLGVAVLGGALTVAQAV